MGSTGSPSLAQYGVDGKAHRSPKSEGVGGEAHRSPTTGSMANRPLAQHGVGSSSLALEQGSTAQASARQIEPMARRSPKKSGTLAARS